MKEHALVLGLLGIVTAVMIASLSYFRFDLKQTSHQIERESFRAVVEPRTASRDGQ